MSAFLIENDTLSKIAYAIEPQNAENLAQDLYNLNIIALKERYGDNAEAEFEGKFEYLPVMFQPDKESQAQLLKSLSCFLYQCSEGKVPNEDLFKRVEKFERSMESHIASKYVDALGAEWK